jgi:predicted TPR repeat methyltransferase
MAPPSDDSRFEEARSWFLAGLARLQDDEPAEAERDFLASLEAWPGRASTLINLAAAQLQLAKPADALANADAALRAEPDSLDALLHRATALLQLDQLDEALGGFDRMIALDAGLVDAWFGRAQALEHLARPAQALAAFERVVALDPARADAWSGCGTLLRELGRLEPAAHAFREALRHGADPGLHAYYLASVAGEAVPASAPRGYVQGLFDAYADEFEEHLVGKLRYDGHTRLVGALAALARGPYRSALDIGCGTGLCGPLVRPMTERLSGLDLAPRMLAKAVALGVYDALHEADAVEFLNGSDERYDLVLATDVLVYIGDLAPLFAAVRRVMERGVFCFSVEMLAAGRGDFQLRPSLRYAHAEAYLQRLAAEHGFATIAAQRAPVREDQRDPVAGLFVYLGVTTA